MCVSMCVVCVSGPVRPLAFGGKSGPWTVSWTFFVLMEFAKSKEPFYNTLAEVAWSLMSLDPHPRGSGVGVPDETASLKKPDLVPGMRNGIARHTSMLLRCSKCAGRFVLGDCGKLHLNSGGLLQLKQVRSPFPVPQSSNCPSTSFLLTFVPCKIHLGCSAGMFNC